MLLYIDFNEETPIYQQIRNQIILAIANGELSSGEKLPPIRNLADEAGVNMMTVSKAYQMLKVEGYIFTDRRSGAIVTERDKREKKMSEKACESLKILAAEAVLSGMAKQDFLEACDKLYTEAIGK
jgi:Predicted transcriptional regulators